MEYQDVVWLMIVTITNLGFGDFYPSSYFGRAIVGALSVFGIFQTALIVGCLSEALVVSPDEKRILRIMEQQRLEEIQRHAAATLIQQAWRRYQFLQREFDMLEIYDGQQGYTNFKKSYQTYKKDFQVNLNHFSTSTSLLY